MTDLGPQQREDGVTPPAPDPRLVAALVANPRKAYAAVTAMRDCGLQEAAEDLALAVIAAGGRIPDGTEFVPDTLDG